MSSCITILVPDLEALWLWQGTSGPSLRISGSATNHQCQLQSWLQWSHCKLLLSWEEKSQDLLVPAAKPTKRGLIVRCMPWWAAGVSKYLSVPIPGGENRLGIHARVFTSYSILHSFYYMNIICIIFIVYYHTSNILLYWAPLSGTCLQRTPSNYFQKGSAKTSAFHS